MNDNLLFTDTETTGFKKSGLIVEGQARVCQIAMILTDKTGRILAQFSSYIKPNGWKIGDGAFKQHGISQEDCENYGMPQSHFMGMFLTFLQKSNLVVAHNSNFDESMMDVETAYYNDASDLSMKSPKRPWYCTQKNTVDICCVPPTEKMIAVGRTHYKTPSLAEAYHHFTGKRIEGAHDAMVDTRACMEIYFGMKGIKLAA